MPTLTSADAVVAYSDTGRPPGRPDAATIVFGHGLLFGGWMFRAQTAALRGRYRCVAIDWRGQGDSPSAADGYDMDTLTTDAVALIEHLDVGAVHYVGLSMGGFVGQRLAARRPELIRSLVLLDSSAEAEDAVAAWRERALSAIFRYAGIAPVLRPAKKLMFGPTFRADPRSAPLLDEWARRLARNDREGIRRAVLAVANRKPVLDELGSIAAPTLVAVGADDAALPPARSRTIAAAIPGARVVIIARSGHSSAVEQPDAVTTLVSSFVDAAPRQT